MPVTSPRLSYDSRMRVALPVLFLLVAACATSELEFETYELGNTTKIATHCAVADPILASNDADGLPTIAQTQPDRVAQLLAESLPDLLLAYDAVDAKVVPRNGQVISGPAGAATVKDATDSMIIVELSGDALCPTAPTFWNGVPLAFFRDGYLD